MTNNNKLLILERSGTTLSFKQEESGAYVLEGCFGEIDKLNRNNRIYTESEYLPQIEALQAKIKSSKLLGELDHPQNFDVSLRNVSHIIEELTYNKDTKQVMGKIRLLDTDAGKQAKALVDAGVPLHISSRAAGTVESNGQVKIKQLFTYDLVADPGFANAELKRVNEALGFDDGGDIFIYEINNIENNQTQTTENKMEQSRFVSTEDFNKYSKYLATEIKGLKESLTEKNNDTFAKEVESLKEYSSYLAEKMNSVIEYNNYMAEKLDQTIEHGDHIAEKVDQSIQYSEKIAESVNKVKEYSNYLAEAFNDGAATHENMLKYVTYLKENLEKVTEYAEYIAENVNKNLIVEADTDAGLPAEDVKAKSNDKTPLVKDADGKVYPKAEDAAEDDAKELEDELAKEPKGDNVGKEVTEAADAAGTPAEDIKAKSNDKTPLVKDADGKVYVKAEDRAEDDAKELESDLEKEPKGDNIGKEVTEEVDRMDAYKKEISEKLQALVEKATVKVSNNPHFFAFISEAKKEEFNSLTDAEKASVIAKVDGKGFLTESQIYALWNNVIAGAPVENEPTVLAAMPSEYRETWNRLSEAKKNQILAQAKYHKLETEYQVRNFWQQRDLRETSTVMEKVEMVSEKVKEKVSTLPYNMDGMAESFAKRFKK
jgi:uncharacterized protein YoxC